MSVRRKFTEQSLKEAKDELDRMKVYLVAALDTKGLNHAAHCIEMSLERVDKLRKILNQVKP